MQPGKPSSAGRAAWAAPLAICCLLGALLLIAATVVLALIPVYLSRRYVPRVTTSQQTINAAHATSLRNGRSLTLANPSAVVAQIAQTVGLPSSLATSGTGSFVGASTANGKKRQALAANTTCESANTLTGDVFVSQYQVNYPSSCTSSSCQQRYIQTAQNLLRANYQQFSVNMTLANGTTITVQMVFCSFYGSSSTTCATIARNNVYLTQNSGSALYQFIPSTFSFAQIGTMNCTGNNVSLDVSSMALQRNGLLWMQLSDANVYTYNISSAQCARAAVPGNGSGIYYDSMTFVKNVTDNSEALFISYYNTLSKLDVNSLTMSVVGNYTNATYVDLKGTNDGRLFGVYQQSFSFTSLTITFALSQFSPTNAQFVSQYTLPPINISNLNAIEYFPYQSNFALTMSTVNNTFVSLYNPITNTTTNQTTLSTGSLLWAAASTCLGT